MLTLHVDHTAGARAIRAGPAQEGCGHPLLAPRTAIRFYKHLGNTEPPPAERAGLLFLSPANMRVEGLSLLTEGWGGGGGVASRLTEGPAVSRTSQISSAPRETSSEQPVPLQCSSQMVQWVPATACGSQSSLPSTQLKAWPVLLWKEHSLLLAEPVNKPAQSTCACP